MPSLNCIRCGQRTYLDAFGYGGPFRGRITCGRCGATHRAEMKGMDFFSLELAGFDAEELAPPVPEEVRNDYYEAQRCSQVDAFKAVVVLCRRALQGALESKGASRGTIISMINHLKDSGIITPGLANLAHGIRFFGNYGAHPEDDELKQVGKTEAEITFKLTGQLLSQIFQLALKRELGSG